MHRLSVLSWNVQRFNAPWYLAAPWGWRRQGIVRRLREARADVVCLQEILHPVRGDIQAALPNHEWIGVGRNDGVTEGEYAPILFDASRLDLLDRGWFWLSEEPQRPSIGWDASQPRIATWARLYEPITGNAFLVVNTHFDHRGREARDQAAWLIAREVLRLSRGDRWLGVLARLAPGVEVEGAQAEMDRIAEKYKNDMEKRSREQQELFRKHKVNPAAGCLPLFLQLPVFAGAAQRSSLRVSTPMSWSARRVCRSAITTTFGPSSRNSAADSLTDACAFSNFLSALSEPLPLFFFFGSHIVLLSAGIEREPKLQPAPSPIELRNSRPMRAAFLNK